MLIFEVVDFEGCYHAILGRPCYAKFMTVPDYTYLKLKMQGPKGIITASGCFEQALTIDRQHFELASALANPLELDQLTQSVAIATPNHSEPSSSNTFQPAEDTREVQIDPVDPAKVVRIGTQLPPK